MRYANRRQAGQLLVTAVQQRLDRPNRPLILALPRGGVPVAVPLARAWQAELDVVVARKIGAPGEPELAMGAVTVDGPPYLDATMVASAGLSPSDVEERIAAARAEAARRLTVFRYGRPPLVVENRTVVIVDDGLATGATARAALRTIREQQPARLALAVPLGAAESVAALSEDADVVICPLVLPNLGAIGRWYADFAQLSDGEVLADLAELR